jgi:hypothetical protein
MKSARLEKGDREQQFGKGIQVVYSIQWQNNSESGIKSLFSFSPIPLVNMWKYFDGEKPSVLFD